MGKVFTATFLRLCYVHPETNQINESARFVTNLPPSVKAVNLISKWSSVLSILFFKHCNREFENLPPSSSALGFLPCFSRCKMFTLSVSCLLTLCVLKFASKKFDLLLHTIYGVYSRKNHEILASLHYKYFSAILYDFQNCERCFIDNITYSWL